MYIDKYWDNYIGGSDDSLNLVAFLEDLKKEEIPLSEIFAKIGLDKQNWDFHQTVEYLEFTHSDGVEMDFHFAIDVVTDLAAILLECSVNGSVNLQDLDEYNTPSRRIRITATPEEHDAMNKALADFAQNPLSYDLHEMMDDEEIQEMAHHVEALRKELYEAAGRLMSRADAKQSFTVSEFKKQMADVYTTSVSKATLDECPMAYKGMQDILDNIGPTADVVRIIRPIYNFKAGDED